MRRDMQYCYPDLYRRLIYDDVHRGKRCSYSVSRDYVLGWCVLHVGCYRACQELGGRELPVVGQVGSERESRDSRASVTAVTTPRQLRWGGSPPDVTNRACARGTDLCGSLRAKGHVIPSGRPLLFWMPCFIRRQYASWLCSCAGVYSLIINHNTWGRWGAWLGIKRKRNIYLIRHQNQNTEETILKKKHGLTFESRFVSVCLFV